MTTDPTYAAEPGCDVPRSGAPGPRDPDTDALPIFAASAAAVAASTRGLASPEPGADPAGRPPFDGPDPAVEGTPGRPRRRALVIVAAVAVLATALAGYLWTTTARYQERADWAVQQARAIGADLAAARTELDGTTAELEAVRTQLGTAQARITALADEKAQVGDDREAQRQLVDYQQRISAAAGTVASALERCVQGQGTLIGYLDRPASFDPAQLTKFGAEVDGLCKSATKANQTLQDELAR